MRGKLGADGGIGDYVSKPKWMRWPTYDRKLEEIFAAEEVVDAHLLGFVQKLERLRDDEPARVTGCVTPCPVRDGMRYEMRDRLATKNG